MQTITDQLPAVNIDQTIKNMGMVMMTVAATLGMVELPHNDTSSKVTAHTQPAFVFATEGPADAHSTQRREREEAGPHYISYSAAMRTPGRTGRY